MKEFIYPQFPALKHNPLFRIGGSGLANCLFVYGKAIVESSNKKMPIIAPVWFNISLGTYLRLEKDKRHYIGLFQHKGEIVGFKRLWCILFKKDQIEIIEGIYDFFKPLLDNYEIVSSYILGHINSKVLKKVDSFDFTNCIAVHVRLGDFSQDRRVPIEWYRKKIQELSLDKRVLLFSDGTDVELTEILEFKNVERVFFGNALADIVAMSKCSFLIGSDSSFSAWGAYLGQVPCIFYKLQFGQVLLDKNLQIIENVGSY